MIRRKTAEAYLFVLPCVAVLLVLIAYPFISAVSLSFTDKVIGFKTRFIGLENYQMLLGDRIFWQATRNTFLYTFVTVPLQFVIGLAMALVLNQAIRLRGVWRGILLMPWVIPNIVAVLVWYRIVTASGSLNAILLALGLIDRKVSWLGSPSLVLYVIALIRTWRLTPFVAINLLAGLQTIPRELYEAGRIDGASSWRLFRHVTIPQLYYVIPVVFLISTIWSFYNFQTVYMLTRGGPGHASEIFGTHAFKIAIESLRLGEGTAISVLMMPIFAVGIIIMLYRLQKGS